MDKDSKGDKPTAPAILPTGASMPTDLRVGITDFPLFDGSSSPEDFLMQCTRLAGLGGLSEDSLAAVIAARCTGCALSVVNELEQRLGRLSVSQLQTSLISRFSAQPTAAQEAIQLSRLAKGRTQAREYGQQVRTLLRRACPEFLSKDGTVKNTSMAAYNAALFRHFLVGLSIEEAALISRLKATTFEAAIEELVREESLPVVAETPPEDIWPLEERLSHVRWASPIRTSEPARHNDAGAGGRHSSAPRFDPAGRAPRSASPAGRAAPRAPRSASPPARRSVSPGGRPAPGGRGDGGHLRGDQRGAGAAAEPGTEEGGYDDKRPACWSCGVRGHFKRHRPNVWLAGRQ